MGVDVGMFVGVKFPISHFEIMKEKRGCEHPVSAGNYCTVCGKPTRISYSEYTQEYHDLVDYPPESPLTVNQFNNFIMVGKKITNHCDRIIGDFEMDESTVRHLLMEINEAFPKLPKSSKVHVVAYYW